MLRLTKKTEYALLALRSLATGAGQAQQGTTAELVTARAIAQRYQIPEMLLAKVLQRLKKSGIVVAAKGSGGGYRLARPLTEVPLISVLSLFDEHTSLVECQDDHGTCQQLESCDIRGPLAVLNAAVTEPLKRMTVQDLFVTPRVAERAQGEGPRFRILAGAPRP